MTDRIILGLNADGDEVHIEVARLGWEEPASDDQAYWRSALNEQPVHRLPDQGSALDLVMGALSPEQEAKHETLKNLIAKNRQPDFFRGNWYKG